MTRRERIDRIIAWFDERTQRWELQMLIAKHGTACLSDEMHERYARRCIANYKFSQKLDRENRARRAANERSGRNVA